MTKDFGEKMNENEAKLNKSAWEVTPKAMLGEMKRIIFLLK